MGKSNSQPSDAAVAAAQASVTAANNNYALGEDQLKFEQQQWANDQPLINQFAAGNTAIQNADITAQTNANQFSQQEQNYYTSNYQPLEGQYLNQVQNYDTPAQETLNAGAAEANVANQFEGQRNSALEQLESYGVDPTSLRYASLDIGTRSQQGAASAAQGTGTIQATKLQGLGLESGAINTGRGYANNSAPLTNAATGAGAGGSTAGTSGSGSVLGGLTASSNAMAGTTAFTNAGTNAMNTEVNAVNGFNYAQNQANAIANSSMSGLGSLFGGIAGMFNLADGGPIDSPTAIPVSPNDPQTSGFVPPQTSPTGGKATDDVPARLTVGEFVIPKDVVDWEGQKSFVGLIDKARGDRQKFSQRTDIGGQPARAIPERPTFVSQPQLPTQQPPAQQAIPVGFH